MLHRASLFTLSSLLCVAACDPSPPDGTDANVGEPEDVASFPASPRPLDLLFVIDDSPSMLDKQEALASAFPQLLAQLAAFEGGLPDLQIGVISSDMGTSSSGDAPAPTIGTPGTGGCAQRGKAGALLVQANVMREAGDLFLEHPRGGQPNYNGTLGDALAAQVRLGAQGCGFEQPLSALKASLELEANSRFLRPAASLAVVILSDEDDCSASRGSTLFAPDNAASGPLSSFRCFRFGVECAEGDLNQVGAKSACKPRQGSDALLDDVAPFRAALLAAKGDPRKVMLGAIAGPVDEVAVVLRANPGSGVENPNLKHACEWTNAQALPAVADPAVRIASLVNTFPGRSVFASICGNDYGPAATAIGDELEKLIIGDRCLAHAVSDTSTCSVVDDTAGQLTAIERCGTSGETTCYAILPDTACASGQRLDVSRASAAPADTFVTLRCAR